MKSSFLKKTQNFTILLFGLAGLLTGVGQGQAAYPEKPITLVVPYAVNGDTDQIGRLLIARLKAHYPDLNVSVENRIGDSGAKATSEVQSAPADGLTMLIGSAGSIAVAPAMKPSLPYRWSSFTTLGVLQISPLICVVRADSPLKDGRALLAAIRKAPGSIKYGHTGPGTVLNLAAQYLLKLGGLKPSAAIGVGYNANAETTNALLEGQIDFVCPAAASIVEPVRSGKLRALFTTAPGRLASLPDVKNAREAGFPDMAALTAWTALLGPPGLPAPVVAWWKEALKKMPKDDEWLDGLEKRGAIQILGTPKDKPDFMKDQFTLYDRLISSIGLREEAGK